MTNSRLSTAIVTGASRGIGRAIALQLARDGLAVVVNYFSNSEAADQVVATIRAQGGQATTVQCDVGCGSGHRRLIEAANELGSGLRVLVNNAGITSPGRKPLLEATEESWDLVMATNLRGPFFLAQQAANQMLADLDAKRIESGTIINISSLSAYAVSTNRADYCIAKAGVRMMTKLFAAELGDRGIRAYEVAPGIIASDMTAPVTEKYDTLISAGITPIRRWGQPEDVAQAVSALTQGVFPFSTGDCINVDGGYHIQRL